MVKKERERSLRITKRKLDIVFLLLSLFGLTILIGTAAAMYSMHLTTWYDHLGAFQACYIIGGIFGISPLLFELVVEIIGFVMRKKYE